MKPLTIEQLKALEVGDWVWLIDTKSGNGTYAQLYCTGRDMLQFCTALFTLPPHLYFDYGKTWLAWKNKEQEECKSETVELPCKVGDTVYRLHRGAKEIVEWEVMMIKLTKDEAIFVCGHRGTDDYMAFGDTEIGGLFFTDKPESERRLAELTKE